MTRDRSTIDLSHNRKVRKVMEHPKGNRCTRGEHLYETGRTTCRLCGQDY